eukprot:COSAG06_NODE_28511_length_573_cov_0.613924_1_plen_40_part_01
MIRAVQSVSSAGRTNGEDSFGEDLASGNADTDPVAGFTGD